MADLIDRQAAIDAVENTDWYHIGKTGELVHGANSQEHEPLYKAKDIYAALERLPSAQPELTENWWKTDHGYMWLCPHCGLPLHSDFEECLRCGRKRPSAQPERKKGKWKKVNPKGVLHFSDTYKACDNCGEIVCMAEKMNFCPTCGADMRGKEE